MNFFNYLRSLFYQPTPPAIQIQTEATDGEEWELVDISSEQQACHQSLSFSEAVGHRLAYQLAKGLIEVGTTVELKNIYGRDVNFNIHQIVTDHAGLNGYVLMPVGFNQLVIAWTGTMNFAGAWIDTQISPGEDSYRRRESSIIRQINQYVKTLVEQNPDQPIEIFMSGHSLGSSLSQMTLHSLQRAICQNMQNTDLQRLEEKFVKTMNVGAKPESKIESLSPLDIDHLTAKNISKLQISIKNAPGVLRPVSSHSSQMAPWVKAAGVEQVFDFLKVHGDPVQMCGSHMALDRAPRDSVVIRELKNFPYGRYNRTAKIARVILPTAVVSYFSLPISAPLFIALSAKEIFLAKKSHTMKFFAPVKICSGGSEFTINQEESAEALILSMKRHCSLVAMFVDIKNRMVGRADYDLGRSFTQDRAPSPST